MSENAGAPDIKGPWLLLGAFVIAVGGLVYELIAGAVSSYLLGDSIYYFSLVIGLFMSAMGVGAWLSRFAVEPDRAFIRCQILLALAGGFSAPILFAAFALIENYHAFLFLVCFVVGALVGLEIPLILRIMEGRGASRIVISNVLTADYIGALGAALLFPLVLAPHLGLIGASLLFGALNLAAAAGAALLFPQAAGRRAWAMIALAGLALAAGAAGSGRMVGYFENRLYQDDIIFAQTTPYQRVTVTRGGDRWRLFLNGSLQFDSYDERRYHEALVHPVMRRAPRRGEVLILGGGDGLATREVLRWPDAARVTLVDIDPAVTEAFRDLPALAALNDHAFSDPRVTIVNGDAWAHLRESGPTYDVIIADLPDPKDTTIGKLYSVGFYADLMRRLAPDGVMVTQSTSPLYAREAFWSVHATLAATPNPRTQATDLAVIPYHVYVPSFGEWGFIMASPRHLSAPSQPLPEGLRTLSAQSEAQMFVFPPDIAKVPVAPNTLFDQPLPRYYEAGWSKWFE